MDFNEFYKMMSDCRMISGEWKNLSVFLAGQLQDNENSDDAIKLFILYFSLVEDGNTYMQLDTDVITCKFRQRIMQQKVAISEENEDKNVLEDKFDTLLSEINEVANKVEILVDLPVIGKEKLFIIDDNGNGCKRLFARKYYNAVASIKESAMHLFTPGKDSSGIPFNVDAISKFENGSGLKEGQKEVIKKGLGKNLLVTGGPGTGKTTSVFFLLLALLCTDSNYSVYLTAPSGKATAKMSESLRDSAKSIIDPFKTQNKGLIDKIEALEGQTIHRLLGFDRETNGFLFNKDNKFANNSIFVIDEASMIDVCLFASLLEAIPDSARVFILGDKNQLPSVECGAVYGELLSIYPDNIVELTETNRFSNDSEIYKLAEKINKGENPGLDNSVFKPIECIDMVSPDEIEYYIDNNTSNRVMIEALTDRWFKHYYNDFIKKCSGLTKDTSFEDIMKIAEKTKILCALKDSTRGADHINKVIIDKNYKGKKHGGFYPGQLLMITRNLNNLALYNGDCGVTVKFENDDTIYFMIRKSSNINSESNEKVENQFFSFGSFAFFPVRMIDESDITPAFAITIHKAQGSGYDDVFVILPKNSHHPLLNRQLLYTAITRTKHHAFIFSNPENIARASENALRRDTGIFG